VREVALCLKYNIKAEQRIPVGQQITFDIGNAIHEFLQNSTDYFGRSFLGFWRCLACGHTIFGRKPIKSCDCGAASSAFRYKEYLLRYPQESPYVTGHPDGFIEVAPGDLRIVDFKTIAGAEFKKLTAPKPEHLIQVNGYMHYMQLSGDLPVGINSRQGILIYISKQHAFDFPFKAFHVEKKEVFLQSIAKNVEAFRKYREENILPDFLPLCLSSQFTIGGAKKCPALAYCVLKENGGRQ
jgi:hypothetical protein